jgi:light-regulated signal transduction histidine kinase (bacteriophytochrome)
MATVLAIALARTITRPIVALQAAAARFSTGDLGARVPESSDDELGRLAREFNRMAVAISDKEAKLSERAELLTQANRELEAFSYSVSHDLRTPLRAIDGFARILLEDYAANVDAEGQRYLKIVRDNAQQMGHLIDDLLAFARLSRQSLNMQPVAPGDLFRQVLAALHAEQDGRQVEVTIGDLPACRGDPALLTQAFTNLISNALKYTRRRETAQIEVGCRAVDRENIYFVKDNGAGFDMQYAQKLFGVFQRLHRADEYEGTGVGLAIVQRVIVRHGGRIWAEAAVDQGATFYFTLPAVERAEPAPSAPEPDPIAQRLSELV